MMIIYGILGVVFLVVLYYIYKKVKKKIMINKDYNRKLGTNEVKIQKDLATLRDQLYSAKDPATKNEIINKIQSIVNSNIELKEEDEK